jgi:hypothetical protein
VTASAGALLNELVICRCEGIGASEVEHAVATLGCRSVGEVKRLTRAGMGACQGKVCYLLVQLALAHLAGPEAAAVPPRLRPPVRGVPLGRLARLAPDLDEPPGTINADVIWGKIRGARGGTLPLDAAPDAEAPL